MKIETTRGDIDLYDGFNYSFNYNISDVRSLNSRKGNFSKTIVIPATKNNNRIFEYEFDVKLDNLSFDARRRLPCVISQNGSVVFRGDIQLIKINLNGDIAEYEIVVFSKVVSFFDAIRDIKLSDIDFSKYNHPINTEVIENSTNGIKRVYGNDRLIATNRGYVYPLVDYGAEVDGTYGLVQPNDLRPALYVSEYIDKLFEIAGISYYSKLFNTSYFNSLVLPFSNGNLSLTDEESNFRKLTTFDDPFNNNDAPETTLGGLPIKTDLALTETQDLGGFYDGLNYTPDTTGSYDVSVSGVADLTWTNSGITSAFKDGDVNFTIKLVRDDGLTVGFFEAIESPSKTSLGSLEVYNYTFSITQPEQKVTLEAGRSYKFVSETKTYIYRNGSTKMATAIQTNDLIVTLEPNDEISVGYDIEFDFNSVLPNIKAIDFIKSLMTMFNLYMYDDPNYTDRLTIESRDEFYNTNVIRDWTEKVDKSKLIEVRRLSELTSSEYVYKYKDGKDFANKEYLESFDETLGTRTQDVVNDFSKKVDATEVSLVATDNELQQYEFTFDSDDYDLSYYVSIYYDKNDNGDKRQITPTPRIIFLQDKVNYPFNTTGLESNDVSFVDLYQAGYLDTNNYPNFSLLFGDRQDGRTNAYYNLYNLFHQNEINEISNQESKVVTAYFDLREVDMVNLTLRDRILFNGVYYRINKIIDYNPENSETTKVELFKLEGNVNYLTAENIIEENESQNKLFSNNFNNQFS